MVSRMHNLTGHTHEFVKTGAWNDDRISSSVRFLSDAHETATLILSEFDIEMFAFNLKFSRDDYIIHVAWRDTFKPFCCRQVTRRRATLLDDTKLGWRKLLNYSIRIGFFVQNTASCAASLSHRMQKIWNWWSGSPIGLLEGCAPSQPSVASSIVDPSERRRRRNGALQQLRLRLRYKSQINLFLEHVHARYTDEQTVTNSKALLGTPSHDPAAHRVKHEEISI